MSVQRDSVTIRPRRGSLAPSVDELWARRELLYFLIWRDLKVRYKQTAMGAAWAVLRPVLLAAIFALFLGRLARVPAGPYPYGLFVLVGLVPWSFFSQATAAAAESVVRSEALVTKVYFPRLLLPGSAVSSHLLDLLIAAGVAICFVPLYGFTLHPRLLLVLPFAVLAWILAFATGTWLAALYARFRDVGHAVPFLLQVWMFASPVVYPSDLVPQEWRLVYNLNPMAIVIDGFRWALLGADAPSPYGIVLAVVSTGILLVSAVAYFMTESRRFADLL